LERSAVLNGKSGRLIFANDQLLERDALPESLRRAGVIFQPLERALIEHEDLVRKHFMTQPAALGSAKFAALHRAQVRAGAFIYVPRAVELDLPIEIFHWLVDENTAVFPHLLLVADEMSKVTVIEQIEHEDLVRKHFMTQPAALGSAKFAALHRAQVRAGAFIYVPRAVELDLPIEIFHWLVDENTAVFPHLLLVADEMSKVTVIE